MTDCHANDAINNAEHAQHSIQEAISCLHALRWAVSRADSEQGMGAVLSMLNHLIPKIGADLEAANVRIGGVPVGLFSASR